MKQYIINEELLEELLKSKEQDGLTPKAVEIFTAIAENVITRYNFDPKNKNLLMGFAVQDCCKHWRKFDPEKNRKAYLYFDQIIKCSLTFQYKKLEI
jgi:hypothetical protein